MSAQGGFHLTRATPSPRQCNLRLRDAGWSYGRDRLHVFPRFGKLAVAGRDDGFPCLIFSELLIIVAIDRPFTGPVKVEPTALAAVLADIGSRSHGG
jgi:hypothetical protein